MKRLEKYLLTGVTLAGLAAGTSEARNNSTPYLGSSEYSVKRVESQRGPVDYLRDGAMYTTLFGISALSAGVILKSIYDATQESIEED